MWIVGGLGFKGDDNLYRCMHMLDITMQHRSAQFVLSDFLKLYNEIRRIKQQVSSRCIK
jgi:hypothetical protein